MIVTSPRFNVPGPNTILTEWTLLQLTEAHLVLDTLDEIEKQAHERAARATG